MRAFAADAETERAFREGLAGREARVRRGRVAAALRSLTVEPASALVAVDLDGAPDPVAAGAEVVSVCAPGTAIVAVGSADTADLLRTLLEHGIADYLVKPVSPAAMRAMCAAVLDDAPLRAHAGHMIAVAGSSGSGSSTLTAAIALEITRSLEFETVRESAAAAMRGEIELRGAPGKDFVIVMLAED